MSRARLLSWSSLCLGLALALVFGFAGRDVIKAQGGGGREPSGRGMTPISERLAPPPMPEHPTQADRGAYVYYLVCMVCHGDRGQGLTEEWRSVGSPADRNCWQSKCHAANHPPEGFMLPHAVPPVMGNGILDGFGSAEALYLFIRTRMPWQAPGSLREEQYWELTAFLARANGLIPADATLTPANAASYRWGSAQGAQTAPAAVAALPQVPVSLRSEWLSGLVLIASSLVLAGALLTAVLDGRKRP